MQPDSLIDAAMVVLEKELGKPYRWGGNDPIGGFDCSGLMIEGLKATGALPREGDWRSGDLAAQFPEAALPLQRGDLLFWNRGARIGHVEMVWAVYDDLVLTIGASGGGSATLTPQEAIDQDAYVKIRPAVRGWVKAVRPW